MIQVQPGQTFESGFKAITGLAGVGVRIIDGPSGDVIRARTTAGIVERPVGLGLYWTTLTAPATIGQYAIVWDDPASGLSAAEDLLVTGQPADVIVIPPPPGDFGPAQPWISGADVSCSGATASDLDPWAIIASAILFEASGRRFAGYVSDVARPCRLGCRCGVQLLSRGHVVTPPSWDGRYWSCAGRDRCGCGAQLRVKLAGYPVQSVEEVTIDGQALLEDAYRLEGRRWLTRADGGSWPSCQDLSAPADAPGTFVVRYTHGQPPPALGQEAAAALACELWKASTGRDCSLPAGVTQVVRQGVTYTSPRHYARGAADAAQRASGLPIVDTFLASYNPGQLRRRPAVWSPDVQAHARRER